MARTIHLTGLKQGIQRVREKGGADPDTLYDLEDGYVGIDGAIEQRPGTELAYDLPAGTLGLAAHNGDLVVFSTSPKACPSGTRCEVITHPFFPSQGLTYIWYAAPFLGYLYVVGEFENGDVYHYWLQAANQWEASTPYMEGQIIVPSTPNGLGYKAHRVLPKYPTWVPGMEVNLGDKIEPTVANGYYYEATETSEAAGVGTPGGSPNTDPVPTPGGDGGPVGGAGEPLTYTVAGSIPDWAVGVPLRLYCGPANSERGAGPFQAYGGLWDAAFYGEVVPGVIGNSGSSGNNNLSGTPHTAGTFTTDIDFVATGPGAGYSGDTVITQSVTIAAKPTYSMMDWSMHRPGSDAYIALDMYTANCGPVGMGQQVSMAGVSTGKFACEYVVSGLTGANKILLSVAAASSETAGIGYSSAGVYVFPVGNGTYIVELDADTGGIVVRDSGGTLATSTLSVENAYDGNYRFAWGTASPAVNAQIQCNMGNLPWTLTPTVGYGGVPFPAVTIPAGFDPATATTKRTYMLSGSDSAIGASPSPSGIGGGGMIRGNFGKSSGTARVQMYVYGGGDDRRVGLCQSGATSQLGVAVNSIGARHAISTDRNYLIAYNFGSGTQEIRIPNGGQYNRSGGFRFGVDFTAGTVEVWVLTDPDYGEWVHLTTLAGLPAGTYYPSGYGAGSYLSLTPEPDGPAGFDDWTITP